MHRYLIQHAGSLALLALLGLGSAARGDTPTARPAPRLPAAPNEPNGVLTLHMALELARQGNPRLAAAWHAARAAESGAQQARAWPNPEFELAAEEFGGTGSREGYDSAETTARFSQLLETGGKRSKRHRLAQAESRLAGLDCETQRRDVVAITKQAFVEVLLAQGRLALADSLLAVAEGVRKVAAERAKAGKVPILEETKAGIEVATARIERDGAVRHLAAARKRLATAWGGADPVFQEARGDLGALGAVPPLDTLTDLLDELPEVARGYDEVAIAEESLAMAKAQRMPDLTVSAGLTRYEEDGSHAGTVGLSLPLPLFDRNAGGLAAAEHEATRAAYAQRAARLQAVTDLAEAHGRLESAHAEAGAIRTELLPGAQQAFEAAQAGYREGKLGHLDVLDTQRTLNEVRTRSLAVQADYHKAAAEVERLTGKAFATIQ